MEHSCRDWLARPAYHPKQLELGPASLRFRLRSIGFRNPQQAIVAGTQFPRETTDNCMGTIKATRMLQAPKSWKSDGGSASN
jgi:hypothetical protein